MRFLHEQQKKIKKTILVISDIHLGAGAMVNGRKNYLEDFCYDREMVEFIQYHCSHQYENREVELIINGDFFDLLAVPFVEFFDDEYWSEEASLAKLKMIVNAHPEILHALSEFIAKKNHKITFIIGNHDGELIHKSLQDYLLEQFDKEHRDRFKIILPHNEGYSPVSGVLLHHGHECEMANSFDLKECVVQDERGKKYFIPPWGSYYVIRVINKFKEKRRYVNAVKPVKKAIINGLIYDTLYTIRFLLATIFYFLMVRFISIFKEGRSIKEIIANTFQELEFADDSEVFCRKIFSLNQDINYLIVGHNHDPDLYALTDGKVYVNTGTWTNIHHLDWGKNHYLPQLTYAQIDVCKDGKNKLDVNLNIWRGFNTVPFQEF